MTCRNVVKTTVDKRVKISSSYSPFLIIQNVLKLHLQLNVTQRRRKTQEVMLEQHFLPNGRKYTVPSK